MLPDFHLYRIVMSSRPAKSEDNELRLRLTKIAAESPVAQELEILVYDTRSG